MDIAWCAPPQALTPRGAQAMRMALPPVHELEDNTGGVLRLKDGTPLPPYLAMPRGLPLTEWYALHRPRQSATLAMLAQARPHLSACVALTLSLVALLLSISLSHLFADEIQARNT
jgi:hypothetical protein